MKKILLGVVASFFAISCSLMPGHKALYQQPHTPPQYAKALLQHANAIGTQVAVLRESPQVSEESKKKLLDGYVVMVCDKEELAAQVPLDKCDKGPLWDLDSAGRDYEAVANAANAAEIDKAVDELVPLLVKLINVIAGD